MALRDHRPSHPRASTLEHAMVGVEGTVPNQPPPDEDVEEDVDDFLDIRLRSPFSPGMRRKFDSVGVGVKSDARVAFWSVVNIIALGVLEGSAVPSRS